MTIQLRRDTAANWSAENPILSDGQPGYDKTNKALKIGDGVTAWNSLASFSGSIADGDKGDITVSGSGATWSIDADAVTFSKIQNVSTASFLGRQTAGTGDVELLTSADAKTLLAISAADVSGLGSLATASSVDLSAQATGTLQAAQAPAHTGDVTSSAGSLTLTIPADTVTNSKLANMAASTIKGNNTGGSADPADLTASQVRTLINVEDGATKTNTLTAAVDFGATFTDSAQITVTGQAWVTAGSEITAQILCGAGVDPLELALLDFKIIVSDLVAGVGFTLTAYSQPQARGTYSIMCIGV